MGNVEADFQSIFIMLLLQSAQRCEQIVCVLHLLRTFARMGVVTSFLYGLANKEVREKRIWWCEHSRGRYHIKH